jgi:hypothetical protein
MPFFGYTVVRKRDWYPPDTTAGTKELVAVASYCASSWVVHHTDRWVTSKAQALRAIREVENGERASLVEQIYDICRITYQGGLPDEAGDRAILLGLCQRFLALENETLQLKT